MMHSGRFDVCQLQYNLIQQAPAHHALPPAWHCQENVNRVALEFLLSDPRVHVVNAGMRWRKEVEASVRWVNEYESAFDVVKLPRSVDQRSRQPP